MYYWSMFIFKIWMCLIFWQFSSNKIMMPSWRSRGAKMASLLFLTPAPLFFVNQSILGTSNPIAMVLCHQGHLPFLSYSHRKVNLKITSSSPVFPCVSEKWDVYPMGQQRWKFLLWLPPSLIYIFRRIGVGFKFHNFELRFIVKLLSRVWLFATPWTVAHQAPPSMRFSRQEYWNGLPFPSPGDLPDPGIEPRSPALQADTLISEPPGKP